MTPRQSSTSRFHTRCDTLLPHRTARSAPGLVPPLVRVLTLLAAHARWRGALRYSITPRHSVLRSAPATSALAPGPSLHSVLFSSAYGSPSFCGLVILLLT